MKFIRRRKVEDTGKVTQFLLTYVRVPTWLPCRLQIYFSGHNWLAAQLLKIDHRPLDNVLSRSGQAQGIADGWQIHGNWTSLPTGCARSFATPACIITGA